MKKILAILISLIFVVTSLSAVSGFCDPPENICAGLCLGCIVAIVLMTQDIV